MRRAVIGASLSEPHISESSIAYVCVLASCMGGPGWPCLHAARKPGIKVLNSVRRDRELIHHEQLFGCSQP